MILAIIKQPYHSVSFVSYEQPMVSPFSAVWYVGLTKKACETWFAGTCVAVDVVGASASVLARTALTLVHLGSTASPCEARQTAATE